MGAGLAIPAGNLLVAAANPLQRSSALSRLNFSWSVGAVACPFLVAAANRRQQLPLLLLAIAGILVIAFLGVASLRSRVTEPHRLSQDASSVPRISWLSLPFVLFAALFFIYLGLEISIGGWIASYAKTLGSQSVEIALMSPSFFYFSLMAGRWLAPLLLRRVKDVVLARAGLLTACGGMVLLLFAHALFGVIVGACAAGFGLAAVYPITISFLSRSFGEAAYLAGSVMFTVANLGGAFLPWLVGYSANRFGSLKDGMIVPLVAGVGMFALYLSKDFEQCDK
jgi:fucose permease